MSRDLAAPPDAAGAVGQAAAGAATSPLRDAADSLKSSFREGSRNAVGNTGGKIIPAPNAPPPAVR